MNRIKFIIVVSTVLLVTDLVYNQIVKGLEDNQSQNQEQIQQFNNVLKKLLFERLGIKNMQDLQDIQNQLQSQNQTDPDKKTAYLCIQLDKNSTERVCKYWNNEDLRPVILNILRQDPDFKNLLRQILQDAFNKAFKNSQIKPPKLPS